MKFLSSLIDALKNKNKSDGSVHSIDSLRALDIGRTRILFAEGVVTGNKIVINRFEKIPVSVDAPLDLGLKTLFDDRKCSKENIHISLKSPQVVTRFLRFPKMNEKELRGVLQFEIEQYVPYEAKDLYLDLAVLQESVKTDHGENVEVFVAVSKKDHIDAMMKSFQSLESAVDAIDVDILACMKSLHFFHPEEFSSHTALLDLGVHVTTLGVLRASQPRFVRDLSFGSNDIAKKLKSRANMGDTDIQDFLDGKAVVDEARTPIFLDSLEGLINDVKVSFDYYRDQSEDGAGADRLFVCGIGSAQSFLIQALEKALDVPVRTMDVASKVQLASEVNPDVFQSALPDIAVVLGLLLRDHD